MLTFSLENRVAVLDLDDGKANAISYAFTEAVNQALDRASQEAGAVVLVGRPGRFCAGFDLNEFKKGPEATEKLLGAGAQMLLRLFKHPQPVVAACTGHAIAGGALVLLTADTRIGASGDFKIGLNETALGMTLPTFGLELSQYRLSRRHLQAATVQARIYGPQEARDAGFLDEVVPEDRVRSDAIALAQTLSGLPGDAYAGNKLGIRTHAISRLEASM